MKLLLLALCLTILTPATSMAQLYKIEFGIPTPAMDDSTCNKPGGEVVPTDNILIAHYIVILHSPFQVVEDSTMMARGDTLHYMAMTFESSYPSIVCWWHSRLTQHHYPQLYLKTCFRRCKFVYPQRVQ